MRFVIACLLGLFALALPGCGSGVKEPEAGIGSFAGTSAGDQRQIADIKLLWCPPGNFLMGSPRGELERRPDEGQKRVTLTSGFWIARYETTQGQWKSFFGELPAEATAELPAGDDLPLGNVNFAEAEAFCRSLTGQG